jgi:hypothetical protein
MATPKSVNKRTKIAIDATRGRATWGVTDRLVFGKLCHLPIEIVHRAFWAVKQCNLNAKKAGEERKL